MVLELGYVAAGTGVVTPISVQVKKVTPDRIKEFQIINKEERNKWCTHGKQCSKYGRRPCCPPWCKLFSEMPQHDFFYLVAVGCNIQEYWDAHPKVQGHQYFGMQGSHVLTRSLQNKVVSTFEGQHFRVGGCSGCQFSKTGKCKNFAPSLEAAGINVVLLAKEVLGYKLGWWTKEGLMENIYAIGGVATNKKISPLEFKQTIRRCCNVA